MKWITIFNKIGKQSIKSMKNTDVYALLENPKTHECEKVPLLLRFDNTGNPYLIKDYKNEKPRNPHKKRK